MRKPEEKAKKAWMFMNLTTLPHKQARARRQRQIAKGQIGPENGLANQR